MKGPVRRVLQLNYDPASNPLNNNEWSFPLLEIIHIAGFALAIGTIFIVDLRLMGIGMLRQRASQLARDLAPWTLSGFAAALISGPLIWTSDPNMYLHNSAFQFKMVALLVALVYQYTVHRGMALRDPARLAGGLVGMFSVLLWIGVIAGGLFIAFV
ncbi:MAG: DUF6644 family protein [Bryobacteraceae bacterium]|jgi:hypothetical protein